MRLAWLTDVHLDFLDDAGIARFAEKVAAEAPDAVLIGGDISLSDRLESDLGLLQRTIGRPIYFVLGNHDFYGGSIPDVRAAMTALTQRSDLLRWLPCCGVVPLSAETALVGHDSWADGRFGDYAGSRVMLNDYIRIRELAWLDPATRLARLNALGDEAAAYFLAVLPEALERFKRVILLTHVPPFEEACWHQGRISDKDHLPHSACKAVGDVLVRTMRDLPERSMTVLCGHTHGEGEARILPNLVVKTGGAAYGAPRVQQLMEVS